LSLLFSLRHGRQFIHEQTRGHAGGRWREPRKGSSGGHLRPADPARCFCPLAR